MRCALLGGNLAVLAAKNGWSGVIVFGCVRDSAEIVTCQVGVKALAAHPKKSARRDPGERDIKVRFAGVDFTPGHYLYADADGVVVAPKPVH